MISVLFRNNQKNPNHTEILSLIKCCKKTTLKKSHDRLKKKSYIIIHNLANSIFICVAIQRVIPWLYYYFPIE